MRAVRRSLGVALALLAGLAAAVLPSTSPPGGLAPERTPMFVLFTHDDAIKENTYDAMLEVTEGRQSLNGCPAVGTMFTTSRGTDCELLVDMHSRGWEIADHTVTHPSLLGLDRAGIESEVLGARSAMAACGIPASDIVGMRNPYLNTSATVREVLADNGFLYDSTLIEETTGFSYSRSFGSRIWPWDMGNGVPVNCAFYGTIQKCSASESHPGLWQVPIWALSALGGPYTMDYGEEDDSADVYEILKANFDQAYNGNRAPFPIFIHTPWLRRNGHRSDVKRFADYALAKPDVYFVTMRQLIAWMQNPVPADELTPGALGCGNAGGAGPTAQSAVLEFVRMPNEEAALAATPAPSEAPAVAPEPAGPPAVAPAPQEEEN